MITPFTPIAHSLAQEIVNRRWSPGILPDGAFWLARIACEDVPPGAEGYYVFYDRDGDDLTLAYRYAPLPPPAKKKRKRKAKPVSPGQLSLW